MSAQESPPASFSAQDALVALMVGVSASDENITTTELLSISRMVESLPVFRGFDPEHLRTVSQTVLVLYTEEDGLDALFGLVIAFTTRYSQPLLGFMFCIYAGWVWQRDQLLQEVRKGSPGVESGLFWKIWPWYVRFVCPVIILAIFAQSLWG